VLHDFLQQVIEIKAQVKAIPKRELPELGLFIRLLHDAIFAEIVIHRQFEIYWR
jgi:hypothetical protein